ncbi:fluoride efflux transporter FluC [Bacillus sp. 1P06AnD]|uniref:fluoride efflux transporter FluC n=1 Tax=Bacillus sp. 1P06AnD TaxID=3132208 RepID=UPI0039A09BCE
MAMNVLLVAIGGFLGAVTRFSISKSVLSTVSVRYPFATLLINLSGSFLLGLLSGMKADPVIMLLAGTGFMGAFTTFSTLMLELVKMVKSGERKGFLFYLAITFCGGALLAFAGYTIGGFI